MHRTWSVGGLTVKKCFLDISHNPEKCLCFNSDFHNLFSEYLTVRKNNEVRLFIRSTRILMSNSEKEITSCGNRNNSNKSDTEWSEMQ